MDRIAQGRRWLKGRDWERWREIETDQRRGLPPPPLEQPLPEGVSPIALPPPEQAAPAPVSLAALIAQRRSHRRYRPEPLTLGEVAFLLWATQGLQRVMPGGAASLRTVPSAGARHPLESYLCVLRVEGLAPGVYRYSAQQHALYLLREMPTAELSGEVAAACVGQSWVSQAAMVIVWTAVPYRTEWRYAEISPKVIALDAGHVCQNLYLAAEALGAGCCAVGAYDQVLLDRLVGVDGEDEFAIYAAPVGRPIRDRASK